MHDRSDYKQGWQLEQEWQEQLLQKQQLENYEIRQEEEEESEKDSEDELPFCCFICRKDFTNPVVTNCRHYFCEKCALIQFKKTPKCFICGINTKGIFRLTRCIQSCKGSTPKIRKKKSTNEESGVGISY